MVRERSPGRAKALFGELVLPVSSRKEAVDAFAEAVDSEWPEVGVNCAAVVDEGEGWLAEDAVGSPDRTVGVDGVIEVPDFEVVDELLDSGDVVASGDTDDEDVVVAVALVDLCDRRGFGLAGGSPRRPEPEYDVLALQSVPVELASAGGRNQCCFGLLRRLWFGLVGGLGLA